MVEIPARLEFSHFSDLAIRKNSGAFRSRQFISVFRFIQALIERIFRFFRSAREALSDVSNFVISATLFLSDGLIAITNK